MGRLNLNFGDDASGAILARGAHKETTVMAAGAPVSADPIPDVLNDFNGDGRSDVLWRDNGGTLYEWLGQLNGGYVTNAGAQNFLPTTWHVAGTGDFNGDGRDDILWRHDSGRIIEWLAQIGGGFALNSDVGYEIPTSWHIVGTGDFNADGNDDILWMNDSGVISDWLGLDDGSFHINSDTFVAQVPTEWHVLGVGDFNGDGRDDIMWQNDSGVIANWLGEGEGAFVSNGANFVFQVPSDWQIVGIGDFNGDGNDDLLWRSDNNVLSDWLGTDTGSFTINSDTFVASVPADWHIVAVGNYDGDLRDDILWESDAGLVANWLGTGNGTFTPNSNTFLTTVPNDWHIQPDTGLFL